MRFARGSFLLDWAGRGGALAYSITDRPDPYHPAWVVQLGRPAGPKFERRPGLWQRRYTLGIVAANTTESSITVRIRGRLREIGGTDAVFVRTPA
jgi:hypothetical protein